MNCYSMRSILLSLLVIFFWACENAPVMTKDGKGGPEYKEVSFHIEVGGVKNVFETRSVLSDDIETKVTDITLAAYDENGILADVKYFSSSKKNFTLALFTGQSYDVYALANMGDMSRDFPVRQKNLPEIEYVIPSYDDVNSAGIPMCGEMELAKGKTEARISLDRLFAKLTVRVLHHSLGNYAEGDIYMQNLCNKSLYVRQANNRLRPFDTDGSRAEGDDDILSVSDSHEDMNSFEQYEGHLDKHKGELGPGPGYFQDTTFVFYVPENVQGVLLPGNADPGAKVYEKICDIKGKSYGDICTYLEFNAHNNGSLGYSGSVKYRYYLGADNIRDFSIERNCRYDLTLDFSEAGFFMDGWKVVRGDDWNDRRDLRFLEDTYTISPGKTEKVFVHFSLDKDSAGDSYLAPELWSYAFDERAMNNAGLSVSFNPNTLVTDGRHEYYCFEITASKTASVGSTFPLTVMVNEGDISDHAVLSIVESPLKVEWDFRPEYVSQYGTFTVSGHDESELNFIVSDPDLISCENQGDGVFKVIAKAPGKSSVTVSTADGSLSVTENLNVWAPNLVLNVSEVSLNPDGRAAAVPYTYETLDGEMLTEIDMATYNSILRPVASGEGYFKSLYINPELFLYINRLTHSGDKIVPGRTYNQDIAAVGCSHVVPKTLTVNVTDPFRDVVVRNYDPIEDYTLFSLGGYSSVLAQEFSEEINENKSFSWEGPDIDADPSCVDIYMEPKWKGDFSNENGVYAFSRDSDTGQITVTQKSITGTTTHSVGRQDVRVSVRNRHSNEKVSASCGTTEIYVHSAIGAKAAFGKRTCGFRLTSTGRSFAAIYNGIANRNDVYPDVTSTKYINYIDVSMQWMMPVGGVYVFAKASEKNDDYGGYSFIEPTVTDGEEAHEKLFSVLDGKVDERIPVCGEGSERRRGVGRMLYRALMISTYADELTESFLEEQFFKRKDGAAGYLTPEYSVSDFKNSTAPKDRPYHFSPPACSDYVDSQGKGYHVIHFLESFYPDSHGWINLMQ